jgi:hypothetical protein
VCPECHGPLQEIEIDQVLQFQCRVDPTEHGAALADAVSGARRLWGYRIPAVVFLEADDPEDTTAWYVRGATCVIRIPRSARRVRVVAVAAFRYWLDVVTLPPAW